MNEKVSVTVNGEQKTFFLGLAVRHAIGAQAAQAVQEGQAEVRNSEGNQVGVDGALYDGETLIVHSLVSLAPSAQLARRWPAEGQQQKASSLLSFLRAMLGRCRRWADSVIKE